MYDLMVEEYKQKQAAYSHDRDEMIRKGHYGVALRIINTKIQMCGEFIVFLKRCEQQEIELEKENRRIQEEEEAQNK